VPEIKPSHLWRLPEPLSTDKDTLAAELGLPRLAAELLLRRGHRSTEAIREFLDPAPSRLHKPDSLPDIAGATERILDAVRRHERILVYGDYDVDGVTGTALLVTALRHLEADVIYYLPHRETEGYGFSMSGLGFAEEKGARLIITNDCGTSDFAALGAAASSGIDVVVTDHHELSEEGRPPAPAFVNPKRPDSAYPFRELAGVGVAFKLAGRLLLNAGRPREEAVALLDLAGLGTIADVVPLVDENRILARLGLAAIRSSRRPGIRALLKVAGIGSRPLTAYEVGFVLAPRLNAAGRVGHAEQAARLLLTGDEDEALTIAQELDVLNKSRQAIEEEILRQAVQAIDRQGLAARRTIVVGDSSWHEGVIGIVASRLVDRFYRPCVVVALKGHRGKGSGRSITGFNLHAALSACSRHLLGFGGHKYAAGLTVELERLPAFAAAFEEHASTLPEEIYEPTLHIDAVAGLPDLDPTFLEAMDRFAPFGPDNAEPVFASLGLEVVGYPRAVGRGHLKFRVRDRGAVFEAIAWDRSAEIVNLEVGRQGHLDICYSIQRRRGTTQLLVEDLRTSGDGAGQRD
jgi:single-stranded-DNA-specific exonuclease